MLGGEGRGEVAANPVAAALTAAMARYALPRERLAALLEARRFDLYDEPMATLAALDGYAEGTASNLIALAAQILNGGRDAGIGALAHHAGLAYAIAGLLKALPTHAARGQLYVPVELLERHGARRPDGPGGKATSELRAALAELRLIARRHLAKARELVAAAPPAVIPALLVLAPAAATLTRMERSDYEPFVPVEIAQWRRQWLIWRAARRPARMFG